MNRKPYVPPNDPTVELRSFAKRYRVDLSNVTLREIWDMSGSRLFGTAYWIGLKTGLVSGKEQIVDGPEPFETDVCELADIGERVRPYLLNTSESATRYGFRETRPCQSTATGVEVHAGVIRMLHESEEMFLQIIGSSYRESISRELVVVSAVDSEDHIEFYMTTNARPKFERPEVIHQQRFIGADLGVLYPAHRRWLAHLSLTPVPVPTFTEVGRVVDHLSVIFFKKQIERGIYVPEP